MLQITYSLDGMQRFIDQTAGDAKHDLDKRDRAMAEAYSSLSDLWWGGESFGELWIEMDGAKLQIPALGATAVLIELDRAMEAFNSGAQFFATYNPGGGYGVSLGIDRSGDSVVVGRARGGAVAESESLLTSWVDLVRAVKDYRIWFHTEYLKEASWLLRIEDIQQLRSGAGYPPDHL